MSSWLLSSSHTKMCWDIHTPSSNSYTVKVWQVKLFSGSSHNKTGSELSFEFILPELKLKASSRPSDGLWLHCWWITVKFLYLISVMLPFKFMTNILAFHIDSIYTITACKNHDFQVRWTFWFWFVMIQDWSGFSFILQSLQTLHKSNSSSC